MYICLLMYLLLMYLLLMYLLLMYLLLMYLLLMYSLLIYYIEIVIMSSVLDTFPDLSGSIPIFCDTRPIGTEEPRAEGYIYCLLVELMQKMSQSSSMTEEMVDILRVVQQMPAQVKEVANQCAAYMYGIGDDLPESLYGLAECSIINIDRTVTIRPSGTSSCYVEFEYNQKSMQIHMGGDVLSLVFIKEY